jgi:luciferase family oxidoreductase group 1
VTDLPAVPLSVLDLAPVVSGRSAGDALHATRELARHVEGLDFTRFWVAEHHNMPGIGSSAPTVVIADVAAATQRIRVGSGGIMLPNHAPLVVAEQFGTLAALHPDRIDLGLGRAPGTDQNTARALRRDAADDDFAQQLGELRGFLRGNFPVGHPYHSIKAVPGDGQGPPIWLLGSSGYSAELAGVLGLPFAFAHHFMARNTLPALNLYRHSFQPSEVLRKPYAMVAVQVIIGDSDAEAENLALPGALSFLQLRQNNPIKLPTVEEAATYPWTPEERAFAAQRHVGQAVGSVDTVRRQLSALLSATQADELMVTTMIPDAEARLRSMDRVREMFDGAELPQGLVAA